MLRLYYNMHNRKEKRERSSGWNDVKIDILSLKNRIEKQN